jgi:hypothetical protein
MWIDHHKIYGCLVFRKSYPSLSTAIVPTCVPILKHILEWSHKWNKALNILSHKIYKFLEIDLIKYKQMGDGRIKENDGWVNPTMIDCKNICKCHSVHPAQQ